MLLRIHLRFNIAFAFSLVMKPNISYLFKICFMLSTVLHYYPVLPFSCQRIIITKLSIIDNYPRLFIFIRLLKNNNFRQPLILTISTSRPLRKRLYTFCEHDKNSILLCKFCHFQCHEVECQIKRIYMFVIMCVHHKIIVDHDR